MTDPGPITRLGAQRAARRELSKSIYHHNGETLAGRAVRAAARWLDHLLSHTFGNAPAGSAGALAVVVLIVVLSALVIWRVGVPTRAGSVGGVFDAEPPVSAAAHRAAAERAAAAADWTTAVVERMRALARELEEHGIVEPRAGRTASELAAAAGRALPDVAADLMRAAETFNRVVYGGARPTDTDYERVAAADELIQRASRVEALAR
ncbi:MAG TPA: DUF4129 domain-containing protein [Mycobacteriales bacterium]|nr:DUF4129 domain-containing protein [Mycobacteriales bacterium]